MPITNKRKIDEENRLPLPLPMRQQMDLNYKDAVVWYHEGDEVIIRSAGKAIGLTGQLSTRVDDVGKILIPRSILQLGFEPGMEIDMTCDGESIRIPVPKK